MIAIAILALPCAVGLAAVAAGISSAKNQLRDKRRARWREQLSERAALAATGQ
jgi:uncharacterized membrane protein HdeD (DUF308 family)